MKSAIKSIMLDSISMKQAMLHDDRLVTIVEGVVNQVVATFEQGGKVLFCGNGGSAADAQHLAAELSGRFYKNRKALFAEALHVNSSFVTAVGNDYGFEAVFERAVEAMGRKGDLLFALSTSGNSANVLKAIEKAHELGMKVVGMTGAEGGKMDGRCDFFIKIPSTDTPRVQEGQVLVGHAICALVEQKIFG
ncbi:MAG: SIS domain-containing protein [Saprospiraceae bacterium]|nr:SIS domain-containing protein [Saprospiraceae bacterium]MCF8249921.1 SIS domain-containing protein [Saprospiraceae bacterium]MCF8279334.1 SIS domain-containing protein [Bacteroidales bacterium]MCF8310025.1 SIS domain-containing protein [Saprospiraceae bacterium]MCF8438925.1 SIS domain-containing protein [Saprospiraceae bacterium]